MATPVILGIDEVGRGPWAGPLVVGAVILGADFPDIGLNDSKKLTAKKRQELGQIIRDHAAAQATGWVTAPELDQYGLSAALKLATRRAVKQILAQKTIFSEIIIDGTVNFLQNTPLEDRVTVLKKADALIKEVSAASIIAKVARDDYMVKIARQYPTYGFEKHVGYGTALHRQALLEHGICPEHRQSFRPIREILTQFGQKSPNTPLRAPRSAAKFQAPSSSQKGQKAEISVLRHLETQNHQILAHNFKTKTYEIDLISLKNRQIYFTEVKYSHNPTPKGTPLARITAQKQAQMRFAATGFLKSHPKYQNFAPILAVASVVGPDYQVENWFTLD